jgi:hypothetical protein
MLGSFIKCVLTNKSAIAAGERLNTFFKVRGLFCYLAIIKVVIVSLGCAALTKTSVCFAIVIRCPFCPLVLCSLRYRLCLLTGTNGTRKGLYAFFVVGGLSSDLTVIPSAIVGFSFAASALTIVLADNCSFGLPFTEGMLRSLVQNVLTNKSAI